MPFGFDINKIKLVILDCLDLEEFQSGQKLYEDLKLKTYLNNSFSVNHFKIDSSETLIDKLEWIKSQVKLKVFFPFLHFEAHGNENGMQIFSSDRMDWNKLLEKLKEINLLLFNNLIIGMSMCQGASIMDKIDIYDRAPFRVLIGPDIKRTAGELLETFQIFYDTYFFEFDFNKAYDSLSDIIKNNAENLTMLTSDQFFDIYTSTNEKSEKFEDIIEPYRQMTIKMHPTFQNAPINEQRKFAMKGLQVVLDNLKKQKGFFMMTDL